MVTAKFKCSSIIDLGDNGKTVVLHAVYGNGEENKDWSKYTPAGNIQMQISNETPAASQFQMGKEYVITFDEVK